LVNESIGMVEYTVEYSFFRSDRGLLWHRRLNPNGRTWEQFLGYRLARARPLLWSLIPQNLN
jgi:hypothetical protein